MTTRHQPVRIVGLVMIVLSLLVAGLIFGDTTTAAPMKAGGPISARVQSQTELCETLGGGKISVSYSYENGKMVSAQTVCKGGSEGGRVCVNDAKTTDCYKVKEAGPRRPPLAVQDLPLTTIAHGNVDIQATPDSGPVPNDVEIPENHVPLENGTVLGHDLEPVPGPNPGDVDIRPTGPTAGEPASGSVIAGQPVTNPNTTRDQNPIVILDVTPIPTPAL